MKNLNLTYIIFLDSKNNLLLHMRKEFLDSWGFLGGGIEAGESPAQALMRELNEEIGIKDVFGLVFLKKMRVVINDALSANVHLFKAIFPGFENIRDSEEVQSQDLKFFSLHEAAGKTLLPVAKQVIEEIQKNTLNIHSN